MEYVQQCETKTKSSGEPTKVRALDASDRALPSRRLIGSAMPMIISAMATAWTTTLSAIIGIPHSHSSPQIPSAYVDCTS